MGLFIQTNISSMQAQKNLLGNQSNLTKSFNRLSSGFRINSAADDAAGLAISESMKAQVRSYTVAERNAADGISMSQTGEGALGEIHDVLGRMRELAVQSSNGSLTASDRSFVQTEFTLLQSEIGRIQASAKFNGKQLVNSTATTITFQVGLDNTVSDQITVSFGGLSLSSVTTSAAVSGATTSQALASLAIIDAAITGVSTARSNFGSAMNRMTVATSNIQTMRINIAAANSRIRDVDVAEETSTMSKNQVLTQAGISILAQANQIPQLASQLLR
jgi:flagellin